LDQRDRDVLSARSSKRQSRLGRAKILGLLSLVGATAHAGPKDVRVQPTVVEVSPGHYAPAAQSDNPRAREASQVIDSTLLDTVGDLGLTPRTGRDTGAPASQPSPDWLLAPRLVLEPEAVRVRLVMVAPGSRVELSREERLATVDLSTLEVRTVVMLRDVFDAGRASERDPASEPRTTLPPAPEAPPSSGRSVLALNIAVLGGYFGYTIQRASGSRDTRLVYPLVALGAGLGLGASFLVADEWDVTYGDAWYLAAGAWWPAASALLLGDGYGTKKDHRFGYSLLAAVGGAGLATMAIAGRGMSEGDAVLAHSGGAFGAVFGAMSEMAYRGETTGSLTRGIGWGAASGVLLFGAAATFVEVPASRVLLIDLSTSLGGLLGAAAASPLLLVNEKDATRTRLWLAASAAGAIGGGIVGWIATAPGRLDGARWPLVPYVSYVPDPRGGALDMGVAGRF
jgi:hypothetical protein